NFEIPAQLQQLTNLADERIGAKVLQCSDDFFAEAQRMLQFTAPIFVEDKFDDHGKWMDGWQTRRKRHAGYDWAIVKLGVAGKIRALDIDTTFFSGNYPASAAVEACYAPDENLDQAEWHQILPNSILGPSQHHIFEVSSDTTYTHLRLNIYPDGGVARLRVYG